MTTCDCSDEYGPCEDHGQTLVIREGASLHTADELVMLLIADLADNGYGNLSVAGRLERERLDAALTASENPQTGTAWFNDPNDGDAAQWLLLQLESDAADVWVIHEDGYRIVRPSADCPLLEH